MMKEDFLNKLEIPIGAPTLCVVSRITGCGLCFVWNKCADIIGPTGINSYLVKLESSMLFAIN